MGAQIILNSGGGSVDTTFGWDNDLTAVPTLSLDEDLSVNVTQAQLLAGLSVSSGALVVDMQAMVDAGAAPGLSSVAVAWLDAVPKFKAPAELYCDAINTTSTGSSDNNGTAGFAMYYYTDEDALTPSNPPNSGGTFCSVELGRVISGNRGTKRQAFGTVSGGDLNLNYTYTHGSIQAAKYPTSRSGRGGGGNTYPPIDYSIGIPDNRPVNAAPFHDDHRLRVALIVRLTGTLLLPTMTFRKMELLYR